MKIKKVYAVYFSPTGNTAKITTCAAEVLSEKLNADYGIIDFTNPVARHQVWTFTDEDLVVFGTPVYAGRVPNKVLPLIQSGFVGGDALVVPMISWGNRNFDNALIELRNELEALGFHTVAGAGVVSSHAMSDHLAVGRPNADDETEIRNFAGKIAEKIQTMKVIPEPVAVPGDDPVGPYYTPLGMDGEPAKFLKAKPVTDPEKCNRCGMCVACCSMGSISREDPSVVTGICIKCHACIRKCPTGAKHFEDERLLSHIEYLETHFADEKQSEFFV